MFRWLTGKSKRDRAADRDGRDAAPEPPAPVDGAFERVASARDAAWRSAGELDAEVISHLINPAFMGGPAWPGLRQAFCRVIRPDGIAVVSSDGLSDPYLDEGPATGLGAEVYLASTAFATTEAVGSLVGEWHFSTLYTVAQNIADMQVELGPQLATYGALSMGIPDSDAPVEWLDPDGGLGVLLGVGLPGVPERVPTPYGDIHLVGAVVLRPDELAHILAGGGEARVDVARRMAALAPEQLAAIDRPSVLPL